MAYKKKRMFKKRPARKSYARKAKRPALKRMIRKEIARNVENKTLQQIVNNVSLYYPAQGALYDGANTQPLGMQPGSLVIAQGTNQGTRVGNQIKVKSLRLKGTLVPTPYSGATNAFPHPIQVRLVLFYERQLPNTIPAPRTDFFQAGSTTSPIVGNLNDMWMPVNDNKYRILASKNFKLGYARMDGNGSLSTTQYYSNNDFKMNCNVNWDLTKYIVKNLKYNDNTSNPSQRGLYMQIMASPAQGDTGVSGVVPLQFSYMQTVEFEDA